LPDFFEIFSGFGSKNGEKPGKTFRPQNLGSKFFQIFRVMAQSPVDVFRGFANNRAFWRPKERLLGPLGFNFAQHRQTLRPSVDGIRSKALHPIGVR
jgi:hypothetical protein